MVTILLADADETSHQLVQSVLGNLYNVVTVANGPMAVQYCAMIQPDLILVNLALPGIDTSELVTRLKMFMPQTPTLILVENQASKERAGPFAGADGIIAKTMDTDEFLKCVQSLLPPPARLPEFTLPAANEEIVREFESQIAALNQANKRLASLNAVSALIGTSLDLEHLTDEILAQLHKTVNFDSATLLLAKGDILEAAASRGLTSHRRGMNVYARNERNSAWRVVDNKLPLIINNVANSEYWESRPELNKIQSWLGVPLISKDRVVGVLTLDKNDPEAFSEADARYIFTLAYQIAIAVENAQLFEEWEDQATRLKLINEVAQEISTILNVNDLLEALARAIFERLNYNRVAILEVDESRTFLALKAIYGDYPVEMIPEDYHQDIHAGLVGKAVTSGQPVMVKDISQADPCSLLAGGSIQSGLIVPVFADTQVEAIISVGKNYPDGFSDQDLWTLSSLASQAATAIENARLYHSLAQRLSDLAMLNEAGQALTSTIALDEMLSIVIERAGLALSAEKGYVLLMDSNEDVFTVAAATGVEQAALSAVRLSPYLSLLEHVIVTGEPCPFKRTTDQPDLFDDLSRSLGTEISTMLVAPLKTRRIIIGLVVVVNKHGGDFDSNDLNLLNALSQLMVGAVENAQLFKQIYTYSDQLERIIVARTQRLQAIRKMSQVVSQGLAVHELLSVVGRDVSQIFTPETVDEEVKITVGLLDGSQVSLLTIHHPDNGSELKPASSETGASGWLMLKVDLQKPLGQVIGQAKPIILNHLKPEDIYGPGFRAESIIGSLMMAPLITAAKTIGLIIVESPLPGLFDESDLETLETLAFQVASAIEHARLLQKTREIAIVEERTRLARDMHDGVAQNLAYLLIQVDRCLNLVDEGSKLEKQLEQIWSLLKQNIDELRRNIFDLRPVDLEGKSLLGVLKNFVIEFGHRWNLETTCVIESESIEVSPEVESSLYRILQETLSNARQHANCSQLSVRLKVKDNQWVILEIQDNGQGFDVTRVRRNTQDKKSPRGLGLISMRERVDRIGGRLIIESSEGHGTRIAAVLPLQRGAANNR